MNKNFWGFLIIFLAVVVLIGVVYVIFFYKMPAPSEPVNQAPVNQAPEPTPPLTQTQAEVNQNETAVSPLNKAEIKADDLVRLAGSFAERYGSFSNQSDYGNLRDLRIFMTDQLKAWADNYIKEARAAKIDTSIYYGIVTKALSGEAKSFDADAGLAEILTKTQRRESAGLSANSTVYYQDILIKYRREQGVWRVDGIYWQSR